MKSISTRLKRMMSIVLAFAMVMIAMVGASATNTSAATTTEYNINVTRVATQYGTFTGYSYYWTSDELDGHTSGSGAWSNIYSMQNPEISNSNSDVVSTNGTNNRYYAMQFIGVGTSTVEFTKNGDTLKFNVTVKDGVIADHIDVRVDATMDIIEQVNGVTTSEDEVDVKVTGVVGTVNGATISFDQKTGNGSENEFRYEGTVRSNDTVTLTVSGYYDDDATKTFEYEHTYTADELIAAKQECPNKSGFDIDVVAEDISNTLMYTVNLYDETGTVLYGTTTVVEGTEVALNSLVKSTPYKGTVYNNTAADGIAATMTKYTFTLWSDMAEGSNAAYTAKEVVTVNSDMNLKATFVEKELSAWYAILNPEYAIPAGTNPDSISKYTNKVAGTIDYFEGTGSTDREYVYGTLMSVPDMNGTSYTDSNGIKQIVTIDSSREYIRWYVVKDEQDGFHVDGVRTLYPTVTYVLDGETIGTTIINTELGFSQATGNYTTTLDGTPAVITENDGSFSGWLVSADGTAAVTEVTGNEDITVYGYSSYSTVVNYVYADGSEAAESVVYTDRIGTTYEAVTSPVIDGFTADKTVVEADELTIGTSNKVIVVTYTVVEVPTTEVPTEEPTEAPTEEGTTPEGEVEGDEDPTEAPTEGATEAPTEEGTRPAGEVEGDDDEIPTEEPTTEAGKKGEVEADTDTETADRSKMMLFTVLSAAGVFAGTAAIAAKKKKNEEEA